jgi:hypothetical protein
MHRFVKRYKSQHLVDLHDSAGLPERESQSWLVAAGIERGKYASRRVFSDEVNYTTSEWRPPRSKRTVSTRLAHAPQRMRLSSRSGGWIQSVKGRKAPGTVNGAMAYWRLALGTQDFDFPVSVFDLALGAAERSLP